MSISSGASPPVEPRSQASPRNHIVTLAFSRAAGSLVPPTWIVCVPGSGFGQKEGTHHARMTILPPDDIFAGMLAKLEAFQTELHKKWAA